MALANQAAVAVRNAQLVQRLNQLTEELEQRVEERDRRAGLRSAVRGSVRLAVAGLISRWRIAAARATMSAPQSDPRF